MDEEEKEEEGEEEKEGETEEEEEGANARPERSEARNGVHAKKRVLNTAM